MGGLACRTSPFLAINTQFVSHILSTLALQNLSTTLCFNLSNTKKNRANNDVVELPIIPYFSGHARFSCSAFSSATCRGAKTARPGDSVSSKWSSFCRSQVLHSMARRAFSSENVVATAFISLNQSASRMHGHRWGLLIARPNVRRQRTINAVPFGEAAGDCSDCSARTVNLQDKGGACHATRVG